MLSILPMLLGLVGLAACGGDATGPRDSASRRGIYTLPVVEVTSCRYGGEYPNCYTPPTPEGSGPSGGGASPPPPPPDSTGTCDPKNDPNCEQDLTHTDSTTILKAITEHVRPDTAIADTANRRKCKEMRDQFMQSFNAGTVFRGGSDLTGTDSHYGATYASRIHFDPWLLDGAASGSVTDLRELANTALHEAAHVLLFEHPNGETNGIYTDEPFNLLPPGAGVCIR